jgi:hypothetical protein
MKSNIEVLEKNVIISLLQSNNFTSNTVFEKIFSISSDLNFKNLSFHAKSLFPDTTILIYTKEGAFLILAKKGSSAKKIAEDFGIK